MNKVLKAHLALLIANLIYSGSFTLAKEVTPLFIKPFGFVLIRVTCAAIAYWLMDFFLIREKTQKKDIPVLLILAIFGVATNQMMFIKGLSMTTPINAAILMVTSPMFVLALSVIILKEKISALNVSGILLGFAGAASLLIVKSDQSLGYNPGDIFILINALSWGVYLVLVKPFMLRYNTITVLRWVFLSGFFIVLPFGYNEFLEIDIHSFTPHIWLSVVFVVLGATIIAYVLNIYALKELSSSVVSAYIYLQPLLAALIALLADKDHLSWVKIISALLIFAGVYFAGKKKVEKTADKI